MKEIIYANSQLVGGSLLYPMQGFYLLHLPLGKVIKKFSIALLGESYLVLVAKEHVIILDVKPAIMDYLKQQYFLKLEGETPKLGLYIGDKIENLIIKKVEFLDYALIEDIDNYLNEDEIMQFNALVKGETNEEN